MKNANQKNNWKILFPLFTFIFFFGSNAALSQICSAITNLQTSINNSVSSNEHAIKLTWTAIPGVAQYEIQASANGTTFGATSTSATNSFVYTAPSTPNAGYWFKVRMVNSQNNCDWTTSTAAFYTSATLPSAITAAYSGTEIQFSIPNETPVNNPQYTKYAVFSSTTNQYVQANGTFGPTAYFAAKTDWASINLTTISPNTTYCFSTKVKNENDDIRQAMGTSVLPTQSFNSNILTQGASANTSAWFTPNSNAPITWTANGNCSGAAIGYSGNWNNFWGNFLRLPKQDCTGLNSITTTFTLTHSYATNTVNNYFRFYIWADNGYKQLVSGVKINGSPISTNNYGKIYFTEARTCAEVEVTFNLASINNKSDINIYLEASSAYNNSSPFSFYLDEIAVNDTQPATTCVTTTLGVNSFESVVSVYPNPVTNIVNISTQETINSMTLFNILGQKVAENIRMASLNTESLPKGNYVLKVTLENGTTTSHQIIKK